MSGVTSAQMWNRTPTPNDTLQSARVLTGGDVVLSIYAPKAEEVSAIGDIIPWGQNLEITKAETGVWTIRIPNVKHGSYRYSFVVDGISVGDPKSMTVRENQALLDIPGDGSGFWEMKDVPHGDIRIVYYPSTATGTTRRMHVYTPPGLLRFSSHHPLKKNA